MWDIKHRVQRLDDKIWLWDNSKPLLKASVYIQVILPWVMVGMMLFGGITVGIYIATSDTRPSVLSYVLLGLGVCAGIVACVALGDSLMKPYLGSIYKKYLELREREIAKVKQRLSSQL